MREEERSKCSEEITHIRSIVDLVMDRAKDLNYFSLCALNLFNTLKC